MEKLLGHLIRECSALLPEASVQEIMHYFNHDEYEMACEGLFIEMICHNQYPKNFNSGEWIRLGMHYKLNIDSVFDADIWPKFIGWCNNKEFFSNQELGIPH